MIKRVLKLSVILLVVVVAFNFRLVSYGIMQLKGQLHIVFNSVSVNEVLEDINTADSIKNKLRLINQIREFGVNALGLTDTKSYTTYFDQHNKPVIWVVTASKPFALEEYLWHFPFLGNVPYKGFFNKVAALKERNRVAGLGYDADIGTVGGWSTLGFFTDPVLSNMLNRSEGQIAELIFHEMTHSTIYYADSTEFNENIATFIGEKGAEIFLKQNLKNDSTCLNNYLNFLNDEKCYGGYMVESCRKLDSLYFSLNETLSIYDKSLSKYRMIAEILAGIKDLPLNNPGKYTWNFHKRKLPDNTYFLDYKRYRNNQHQFTRDFNEKAGNSMKKFISFYNKKK